MVTLDPKLLETVPTLLIFSEKKFPKSEPNKLKNWCHYS